jgi:phage baseplate assembly protein W
MAEDRALQRRKLLGWGLELAPSLGPDDIGRDLVLAGGELAVVDGIDNLGQALAVALTTPLTGDVFNVDFGFDGINALAEETIPILIQERIRVAVVAVLKKDPRIRRIVDVQLLDGRLAKPGSARRELDVKVVFETVTGDTATVDLGKVT